MEPIGVEDGPARRQYLGKFLLRFVEFAPPRRACSPSAASKVVALWDDVVVVLYEGARVDALMFNLSADMQMVGYLPNYRDFGIVDLICGLGEALLEVGRLDEAEAMLDECLSRGPDGCRDSTWRRLQNLKTRIVTPRNQLVRGGLLEKLMRELPAAKYSAIARAAGCGEDAAKRGMGKLKRMGLVSGARGQGYDVTPQGKLELERLGPDGDVAATKATARKRPGRG